MTVFVQAAVGAAMVLIGGIKTWLHMGAVPVLALPMCSGKEITLALGGGGFLERAHCWGCYALIAGVIVMGVAAFKTMQKRRPVTWVTD